MGPGKPLALNILVLETGTVLAMVTTSYYSSRNSSGLMLELAYIKYVLHIYMYMWLRN